MIASALSPSFLKAIRWSATPRVTGSPSLVGIGAVAYFSAGFFSAICPTVGGRPSTMAILPWMNTSSIGVRSVAQGQAGGVRVDHLLHELDRLEVLRGVDGDLLGVAPVAAGPERPDRRLGLRLLAAQRHPVPVEAATERVDLLGCGEQLVPRRRRLRHARLRTGPCCRTSCGPRRSAAGRTSCRRWRRSARTTPGSRPASPARAPPRRGRAGRRPRSRRRRRCSGCREPRPTAPSW